jgi:glycosyltransferase involved in cell wall biosynthesis
MQFFRFLDDSTVLRFAVMNRPLNVLRTITWLPVGGIERKILAILPRLDPERFRVRLVCLRERGPLADALEASGIPVDVCEMPTRLSPTGIRRLIRYMKQHEIDIVHAHMYRSSVPSTVAGVLAGVPVRIAQIHNVDSWDSARQRTMDRFLARWRSAHVAVSESVRRDAIQTLKVRPDTVRTIYNGVDIAHFGDRSLREPMRRALNLGPEDIAIIYHGRLVPQKNPMALLAIAREVAIRRSGVVVLVAGDGSMREELERHAADSIRKGKIRFLGVRDDIPALLQASDIAVLPSLKEGFSNAVVEAMAAGLPMVASDVGGNAEAVVHGESGWIVPSRDEGALLNAITSLVDNADERRRMSENARRRSETFSLDRMIDNVETLYTDLAQKAGLIS